MLDRQLTLSLRLGGESGNNEVMAWAQELCTGSSLPRDNYRGALAATNGGAAPRPEPKPGPATTARPKSPLDLAGHCWSRCPTPEKLDNHSGVDPAGQDTCSIECYGS
jgi:hypothetical protein